MTLVFLGAPKASELDRNVNEYHWRTVQYRTLERDLDFVPFPPATLEAASRRISLMYQNVIFRNDEDEGTMNEDEQKTFFTWPPTAEGDGGTQESHDAQSIPSFLEVSKSMARPQGGDSTRYETQLETQESQTFNYSDASSIARFPNFHFSMHTLSSLAALTRSTAKGTKKVTLLLAALEVDGPDTIYLKKGKDAGQECSVLKMILGDEDGNMCKLTAWRDVAHDWGGMGDEIGCKRGDILLLTDVLAAFEPGTTVTLTASPWQKPKMQICYRTMPYTPKDQRLRPDLRLGASDASVRKVAGVVRWFENMAGLEKGS